MASTAVRCHLICATTIDDEADQLRFADICHGCCKQVLLSIGRYNSAPIFYNRNFLSRCQRFYFRQGRSGLYFHSTTSMADERVFPN